jgi:pSer/pThr/pTyr-binding forkhead associated (FHA) protein
MILCPNCLHKEMVGAVFCSECGSQLIFPEGVPTGTIKPGASTVPTAGFSAGRPPAKVEAAGTIAAVDAEIALNILGANTVLPLDMQDDVTLGRISEGQPIVPDVDLTPYKAYEAGVSRIHASLHIAEGSITVTDLGSANGTRINGRQITSHIPYPLKHGDILTLGKFKIQVLLRSQGPASADI